MTFLFNFASESYLEMVLPHLWAVPQIPRLDLLGKGGEEFVRLTSVGVAHNGL